MHLKSDDLLAQMQRDFPAESELARLRLLVAVQQAEIDRLTAQAQFSQPAGFRSQSPEETRYDLTIPQS